MQTPKYDQISAQYADLLRWGLENSWTHFAITVHILLEIAADLKDLRVCDLGCGEGHLARSLAQHGAIVTGVDLSTKMLALAKARSAEISNLDYVNDDAQSLKKLGKASFDLVISNLAFMDIPDLNQTYQAVQRILKPGGRFIFSILHPCFEAPFQIPESQVETDTEGNFVACRVIRYTEEGYWNSGGDGIRGAVGAYHRKISTYINGLLDNGFRLQQLHEPTLPPGNYKTPDKQWLSKVPKTLIVDSYKP
ncbi:MAG: class I SAM-dependent methyltransferase [Anaerolineales bacterium]|nr:class I SAM-dependent methyltransferase [Anaerolineales bacterium]